MSIGILLVTHEGVALPLLAAARRLVGSLPLKVGAFELPWDADLDASISNTTSSNATGRPGTQGLSLGGVLSMNKVSSDATASIVETAGNVSSTVAGGGIVVLYLALYAHRA